MPKYIEKLKEFEKSNPLPMQKTRVDKNKSFSFRVENMLLERVIKLKKLGVIEELNLVEVAGRLLSAQKKKSVFND